MPPDAPPNIKNPEQPTPEEMAIETAMFGGQTLFVNRFFAQNYPADAVRIVFSEQFSPNPNVPPAFRTAVFMHRVDALELARILQMLLQKDESLGQVLAQAPPASGQ